MTRTCCGFAGAMGDSWRWMREEKEGVMKAPTVERPASVRRVVNLMVAFVMIGWVVGCGGIHGADVESQKRSKDISLKICFGHPLFPATMQTFDEEK